MKNSIILGFALVLVAICFMCFFIHSVLVLTIGDAAVIVLIDIFISYALALYLSGYFDDDVNEKTKNSMLFWFSAGIALPIIPIIAAIIKYKRNYKQ